MEGQVDYKHLQESYSNFKESTAGIHFIKSVYAMIESHHEVAEKNPENAVYEMNMAAGLREALNFIDTMTAKSPTERGAK